MEASNLGFQIWAIAIHLMSTSLKGVSSAKLHRDLNITQKSAWHLAMRLRRALVDDGVDLPSSGPVEAGETYTAGKERNRHERRKPKAGRGGIGKSIVVGVGDREPDKVAAEVVPDTKAATPQGFVEEHSDPKARVYTDEGASYAGTDRAHESVNHSAGEYVREMAHTKGAESFRAILEPGHRFGEKRLQRNVDGFSGRHSVRNADTISQMQDVAAGMEGKRPRYRDLIADNGLPSGAEA